MAVLSGTEREIGRMPGLADKCNLHIHREVDRLSGIQKNSLQ